MRADPALAGTPIVIISARGAEARERAAELGVDVYLQKPAQFADIIETVRTLLRIA
jgi:DNA-binding response OmpR family regulator